MATQRDAALALGIGMFSRPDYLFLERMESLRNIRIIDALACGVRRVGQRPMFSDLANLVAQPAMVATSDYVFCSK